MVPQRFKAGIGMRGEHSEQGVCALGVYRGHGVVIEIISRRSRGADALPITALARPYTTSNVAEGFPVSGGSHEA